MLRCQHILCFRRAVFQKAEAKASNEERPCRFRNLCRRNYETNNSNRQDTLIKEWIKYCFSYLFACSIHSNIHPFIHMHLCVTKHCQVFSSLFPCLCVELIMHSRSHTHHCPGSLHGVCGAGSNLELLSYRPRMPPNRLPNLTSHLWIYVDEYTSHWELLVIENNIYL